jgi:DNA-binding CsgD family transcriptional regulator/biotin operon repressor
MYTKRKSRLKLIEQLLASKPDGYTINDLSERFGISERMIFLDIAQLRSTGSPIVGIPGPGGGIALDKIGSSSRHVRSDTNETVEIFGYIDERFRLTELLHSASDGRPSTAIVLGEMGAGKSYIIRDLIQQAERVGFSVLTGNSLERTDAPVYWPWASVLDGLSNFSIPRAATRNYDRSVNILERAFPIGVQSKRVKPGFIDALSPEGQLQIHEAGRLVLETAAHRKPILIAIEDIHWADERTLELIYHLMQSIDSVPVLIVVTVRTPVEDMSRRAGSSLSKILASRRGTAITLGFLKKHEAALIMRSVSKGNPPASAITAAYNLSGGNPFFMREISLLLNHRYDLNSIEPNQQLDIPVSVKLAIEARLEVVDPATFRVLQLAAALGREIFEEELVAACENMLEIDPSDSIARIVDSGIMASYEQTGQLRFNHELIRQTIYESIKTSELPEHHYAAAKAIERQRGTRAEQQPSYLAQHYWIARSVAGMSKYAHYEVLAALEQMESFTSDDVMSRLEIILEFPIDEIAPRDRALAWFGLGKSTWFQSAGSPKNLMGSNAVITECHANAFYGFLESGDIESALMVATHISPDYLNPETIRVLQAADQLSGDNTRIGIRIKLAIALVGYFNEEVRSDGESPTLKELSRILYLARSNQDVDLEKEVLSNDARIRVDLLDLQAGIDRSLHYLALSEAGEQFADSHDPHFQTSRAYATLGDLNLARVHAPMSSRISTSLEHNILSSQWHAMNWSLAICEGDWDTARAVLPGMRQWAEESQIPGSSINNSIRVLETYLDSMTSVESELDDSWYSLIELSSLPLPSTSDPAQIKAVIALQTGEKIPMELTRKVLLLPPATNLNIAVRHMGPFHRSARDCVLGIHAAAAGDVDSAGTLYKQLARYTGIFAGILSAPLSVDRVLGLLAGVSGQVQMASGHFINAAKMAKNGGFLPEHAQTLFVHARLLMRHSNSANLENAFSLLKKSKELANSIQMRTLVTDCEEALAVIETPDSLTGLARFGLTGREVDVLTLIADGMRNQEIGEELFISINTVQHHVRNILRKTGAPNRTGAAALVTIS